MSPLPRPAARRFRTRTASVRRAVGAAIVALAFAGPALAQQRVTIAFDGAEAPPRRDQFDFLGSHWRGGRIETERLPALNASGGFFYVPKDTAEVSFAQPVNQLRLFYVHGFGHAPGQATAFAPDGQTIGSVDSVPASFHGAPDGFVDFDADALIARVTFDGGVIDSVTYVRADAGIPIDTSFNGAWVNTTHPPFIDGQGMLLEYIPEVEALFVAWYIYDDAGNPRWLTAQGAVTGSSAVLDIVSTSGGRLSRPDPVERASIGTMSISFTACDHAVVQVDLPGVTGADASFEISRLRGLVTAYRCD